MFSGINGISPALEYYSPDYVTRAKADLNGDRKLDEISIIIPDDESSSDFELQVNQVSVKGSLSYKVNGFVILDIKSGDGLKEIAVYTEGPSSDDEYMLFSYDGRSLKKMGILRRWPIFPGSGIVYVDDHMGFWSKRDKYILDEKTRTLKTVPQEFYYVGKSVKVKKTFPIYQSRKETDIAANLAEGSEIMILACDPSPATDLPASVADEYFQDWYLIRSSTNLLGWSRLIRFWDKVEGLPWAD